MKKFYIFNPGILKSVVISCMMLLFANTKVSALAYYLSGFNSYSIASQSACYGAATSFNAIWTNTQACPGSGSSTHDIVWYYNTVNSTSGGTAVQTQTGVSCGTGATFSNTLLASNIVLPPAGITYYYYVVATATSGCIVGGNPSTTVPVTLNTPGTQASNIVFSAVGNTQMTVSWTNGTGSSRIVKMNMSNSFTAPVNGVDPTANTVYAGSGEQVVYNAAGNSVTVTGLTIGYTYWFEVYEKNCSGANATYNTATATNNPLSQLTTGTCSAPGTQASNILFSNVTDAQMDISWTNGTGYSRIVKINTSNSFTPPVDGVEPAANSVYGGAGEQVIYNGTSNSMTVTGLTQGVTYYFEVFEANCTGTSVKYITTTATNNPNNQATTSCTTTPVTQASSIVFSNTSSTQVTISWTNGNGTSRIVKANTVNTFTSPTNGTDPAANSVWQAAGEQVIYNGTGNSVTITNLTPSTTYWFRVYEKNCTGVNTKYITSTATNNPLSSTTGTLYKTVTGLTGYIAWSSTATWVGGVVPPTDGTADVLIQAYSGTYATTNAVAFNAAFNVKNLTVAANANIAEGGSSGTFTQTVNGDFTLNSGSLWRDVNWAANNEFITMDFKGNVVLNGTMGSGASSGVDQNYFTFSGTSAQTISGTSDFRAMGQAGSITFSNAAGVTLSTNVNTTSTIGSVDAVTISTGALVKFGLATNVFSGGGALNLNGLTELSATTFNTHYAMSGTRTIASTSTITYKNTASNLTPTTNIPNATYGNITANVGAGGTLTIGAATAMSGIFTITSGTVVAPAANLSVGGNWVNNGTFTHSSGTVIFTNASTISGSSTTSFNNLTINASSTLTGPASGTMNVASNWVNNGTFTHNSSTVTFNGTTAITGASTNSFSGIAITGTLTGPASANMNVAGNWANSGTFTPNSGTVTFNGVSTVSGSSTTSFNNVTVSGALTGHATNMNVAGNWANNGTFAHNNGTVTFNGTAQAITGSGTSGFYGLTIGSNTTNSGTVTVEDVLTFSGTGRTLTNSNSFSLLSTASKTARVAPITVNGSGVAQNNITGNIIVHRFFPAHRAWRLVSAPVAVSSQFIKGDWQEGTTNTAVTSGTANGTTIFNSRPGFGTLITGLNGSANTALGFDISIRNNNSMMYFNSALNSWVGIPSTTATKLSDYPGYMMFVRGSRLATFSTTAPGDNTILRSSGTLNTGKKAVSANSLAIGSFQVVGNPYASTIDFHATALSSVNVADKFSVWDPSLAGTNNVGGFVTLEWFGGAYILSSASAPVSVTVANARYIQSGQAVLIEGSGNATQTVNFNEADKQTTSTSAIFSPQTQVPVLRTELHAVETGGSTTVVDGTVTVFGDDFSNGSDSYDASKPTNINENIGFSSENRVFAIQARKAVVADDTLHLFISQMFNKNYKLEILSEGLDINGLSAFLIDKYTATKTLLDLTTSNWYNFTVTNDAGTDAADRFKIVFEPNAPLPVTFTAVKATQIGADIKVEWKVTNEINIKNYVVERSKTGADFRQSVVVSATNNSVGSNYSWLDTAPENGANFYRIRSINASGKEILSNIVKINIGGSKPAITVSPNPVTDGNINVQFANSLKGIYTLRLFNSAGQVIIIKTIDHAGGSSAVGINSSSIAHGSYKLQIQGPDTNIVIPVIY